MYNVKKIEVKEIDVLMEGYSVEKIRKTIAENLKSLNENKRTNDNAVFLTFKYKKMTPKFIERLLQDIEKNKNAYICPIYNGYYFAVRFLENDAVPEKLLHLSNSYADYLNRIKLVNREYDKQKEKENKQKELEVFNLTIPKPDYMSVTSTLDGLLRGVFRYSEYLNGLDSPYDFRTDLDLDVSFQRELVWSLEQKQKLIRSLLLGLPIGSFYINTLNIYEHKNESLESLASLDMVVIDGKQRLSAIVEYLQGEFPVNIEGKDCFFGNLPYTLQHRITHTNITYYKTFFNNLNEMIHFYLLINSSQTAHTPEDLLKARKHMI